MQPARRHDFPGKCPDGDGVARSAAGQGEALREPVPRVAGWGERPREPFREYANSGEPICGRTDGSSGASPHRYDRFIGPLRSLLLLALLLLALPAFAEARFPPPEFVETGHQLPGTTTPGPRSLAWQYIDVGVLVAFLGVATWMVHRTRTRRGLFWLGIGSVLYFGFFRQGCICAIGSPQNVTQALFDPGYAVPFTVMAFFLLPLAVALFFGRTFCAAVCPHGALQDLVLVKPLKLPAWLEHGLGVLPYVFLGAGVWFAATGSIFLFCHYDPFVPLFRFNGRMAMVLTGAILLALGTVVGRPYCRFLCPYGALLKMASVVSKWRVRTTPDYCTQCRLCEASCPYGAMREPSSGHPEPRTLAGERRTLAWAILALPVLLLAGGWLGSRFAVPASHVHPQVALAEALVVQKDAPPLTGTLTPDELAVARAQQSPADILNTAAILRGRFIVGGWFFGAWVGLVVGVKLINLSLRRARTDYEPDAGNCVACARCFDYCPNELVRRGHLPASALIPAKPVTGST